MRPKNPKDRLVSARPDPGRRKFIGATGTALLAAGVPGLTAAADSTTAPRSDDQNRNRCAPPGCDYDVVVVGGGFAGVTAARDARENGYSTLLLEARNRLGGRTFTTQFEGQQIELGGTWIHWSQPFVWAEKERYGLDVKETPGFSADRTIALVEGRPVEVGEQELGAIVEAYMAFTAESRSVLERPWDIRHTWDQVLEADRISSRDKLATMDLSPLQRDVMDGLLGTFAHNSSNEISYFEALRWASLTAYNDFAYMLDAVGRFQFSDGTSSLLDAMLADGRPEVRLSSPVERIEDLGDRVAVTTRQGDVIHAAAAIITLPMNVLDQVSFQPALPGGAVEAARIGHTGQGNKLYFRLKGRHGKLFALAPSDHPISTFWTYYEGEEDTLMVAFNNDRDQIDVLDEQSVQTAVRTFLPDAEVLSVYGYDWVLDPWSRGTYPSYRPGWINRFYDDFQQDSGRLLFASGDHGEGWRGFIDGAIGAGIRAAQRLRRTLGPAGRA